MKPLNYTKRSVSRYYRVFYTCINVNGEKRQFEKCFRNKDEAISFANDISNSIYGLVGMTEEVYNNYLFEENNK